MQVELELLEGGVAAALRIDPGNALLDTVSTRGRRTVQLALLGAVVMDCIVNGATLIHMSTSPLRQR